MSAFILNVSDLLGHPGARRTVALEAPLDIRLDLASVVEPVFADLVLEATVDEVVARGTLRITASLRCNRCLAEWDDEMSVAILEVFGARPVDDGPIVERDGSIDLEQILHDEASLALPIAPLCRPDCLGLCPTCGTDLNTDPCSGHADESASPFGALRYLLEP
ncbi:hypothetical protein BMS3Abin02_00231 [bacterium BMS3Abin02]|nr:hypothetical protein BMS3Abin02_00231 [bacterium BMS3Abin02]HDL48750.1 DUF177 domain-containing protein [Actinomycetota bacterium]